MTRSAAALAKTLLDEKLIACANVVPRVDLLFVRGGARDEASEAGMLLKTQAGLLEPAIARIAAKHPFAAFGSWQCIAASPAPLFCRESCAT